MYAAFLSDHTSGLMRTQKKQFFLHDYVFENKSVRKSSRNRLLFRFLVGGVAEKT